VPLRAAFVIVSPKSKRAAPLAPPAVRSAMRAYFFFFFAFFFAAMVGSFSEDSVAGDSAPFGRRSVRSGCDIIPINVSHRCPDHRTSSESTPRNLFLRLQG
jgi:hypothetical protein